MKKSILTLAVVALISSCNKNSSSSPAPSNNNNNNTNPVPTGTVHCWYQVFNGMNTYYTCTTNQSEYNQVSTFCASNQMNMVVSQKNSCAECQ